MRAVIYLRVSSEMQHENFSIDSQRRICAQFCEIRGWKIINEYVDDGFSAKTTSRPDFERMLAAARASEFDVIVCHKLDRFSRSILDILTTLNELEKYRVAFASATEQHDFTTPLGRVLLTLLAAFAQWYIDNLSVETARGKRERFEQGHHNNRPPIGYTRTNDTIEFDANAPHVKAAFEMYATSNHSDEDIATYLSARVGKPIGKDSAAAILRNPFYAGWVVYRGGSDKRESKTKVRLMRGNHAALIDQNTYDEVTRIRASRSRHGGAPKSDRIYLFGEQLAVCAACGRPLRAKALSDRDYAKTYRCTSRERGLECSASQSPVRETFLTDQLERMIAALTLPKNMRDLALSEISSNSLAESVERERKSLEAERERVLKLFQRGHITEAGLDTETERIAADLARLPTPTRHDNAAIAIYLDDMLKIWQSADETAKRDILRILIERVIIDTNAKKIAAFVPRRDFANMFEASKQLRYLVDGSDGFQHITRGIAAYKLP